MLALYTFIEVSILVRPLLKNLVSPKENNDSKDDKKHDNRYKGNSHNKIGLAEDKEKSHHKSKHYSESDENPTTIIHKQAPTEGKS